MKDPDDLRAVAEAIVDSNRFHWAGAWKATNVQGMVATEPLEALVGMLERGEIRIPETRTFPLDEAAAAIEQIGSGHARGKIVVVA